MKLNQKIILVAIIPLLISTSISSIITTEFINDKLLDSTISHIKSLSQLTENEMRNPMNNLDIDMLNEIINHLEKHEEILQVLVFFPDGRLFTDGADGDFNYGINIDDDFIHKSIVSNDELMVIEKDKIRVSNPILLNEKIGIIVIDYSTNKINMIIQNSFTNIIGITIIIFGAAIIIAIYLSKSISNPILKMKRDVENISRGDLKNQSSKSNISEIDELASIISELGMKIENYQKELVKKERLSTIGEMASRVTHDLRNPLTIIKNSIEILKSKNPEMAKENQRYFDMMNEAASRMNHQIDEVLGFVKIKLPEKTKKDFSDIISKIINSSDQRKNIEITLPKKSHEIWCDEIQIQNVLINLISNSIHAIEKDQGKIIINLEKEDQFDKITIEDNGVGIPEKSLEMIFDPLYTTKQNGTGLGLVSCKNIIEAHKGKIYAQNSLNGGAIFTILLPSLKDQN